jgi:hypothetical protein
MEDEIESLRSIHPVNACHEAVLVGVVNLGSPPTRLLEPAGVVDDDVSSGQFIELAEIFAAYEIVDAASFIYLG